MEKKTSIIVSIVTALAVFLTACGSQTEQTKLTEPDDTYWAYYDACSNQNSSKAKEHLTESAKQKAQTLGVCGFTHDAINAYEKSQGNPVRTFSQDPELRVEEKLASLTWIDDMGNLAIVYLIRDEGDWKIRDSRWSK